MIVVVSKDAKVIRSRRRFMVLEISCNTSLVYTINLMTNVVMERGETVKFNWRQLSVIVQQEIKIAGPQQQKRLI